MSNAVERLRSGVARPKRSHGRERPSLVLTGAILAFAVLAVFGQACRYDFINFDDHQTLVRNPLMNPPTLHSLKVWWTSPCFQLYDPMTATVRGGIALLARVPPDPETGDTLNPWVFHTVNILLHIGVTLLVYRLLVYLQIRPWPACAGALLFAIHPAQVEPVVWITSIKDLLYGTFGLVAIWRFLVSLGHTVGTADGEPELDPRRALCNYLFATLCFVLAMLSKPTGVILPLLVLPLLWLQWQQLPRQAWSRLAIWVVLAIPIATVAKYSQPAPYTVSLPIWRRFGVAGDAVAFYLFKIVWPKTLLLQYDRNPTYITEHGLIWWTWIVPAVLITILWLNRRRCAPALAGMCFFVAGLFPVLGFFRFNFQYYSTVADRYLYLPMFGIALIAAWAVERLTRRYAVLSLLPLLFLAARSAMQVQYWQDSLKLFGHVLENNPESAIGNILFANELNRRRDYADAIGYARRSIQIDPHRSEAYAALAKALDGVGRTDEAVETFREGFRHDFRTRVLVSDYALELLHEGNNPQHALVFARLAVELVPRAETYVNLGSALAETNDWQGARHALETAVSLDPNNYNAQCDLGTVLDHLGDRAGAIAHYQTAASIDPDNPAAVAALKQMSSNGLQPGVAPP